MPAVVAERQVLLVEDDRDIRAALGAILADEGFDVLTVPNGFDGLASLDGLKPDLIILDWMMPVIDGGTFLQALRAEYTHQPPVLVITAGRITRDEALLAGANDYLLKPFDIDDLIRRVRALAPQSRTADT